MAITERLRVTAVRRPARRPALLARHWWLVPLGIFVITRVVEGLMLAVLGRDQVAFVDGPDSKVVGGELPASPGYTLMTTNWDGQWYESIATGGYPGELPLDSSGDVAQSEWAFYPLYPALVRLVMELTRLPFAYAAMGVSLVCGAAAMCVLFAMLSRTTSRFGASLSVLALCTFPASLVLQTAYSESTALLLVVGCLALLSRRRYGALAGAVVLLCLTRPIGIAMVPVIAVHAIARWRRRGVEPFPRRERVACALSLVAGVAGFAIWPAVVALVSGHPLAYLDVQGPWYEPGAPTWLGYVLDRDSGRLAVLVVLAFLALLVVVLRPQARAWPVELRTWPVAYAVFLLTTSRPLTSAIRISMLAVIPWWPVPLAPERQLARPAQVAMVVGVGLVGLASSWFWIDHFFVGHVGHVGNP